jgi:RNA polymerase sporulation-specific sigma factor
MIGLFKAIRNYNEEKGCNFFSFAELCIGSQLYSALESSNRKKHQPLNTYISFSATEGENGMTLEELLTGYGINPEQMMLEAERQREFAAKLEEKLSPMEKKVLKLYLDGNSYIKIGELLGKPAKSIDNTLQRIRSKIRTLEENN